MKRIAQTKEEFEQSWLEHIHQLYALGFTLTQDDVSKLTVCIHQLEDILKRNTLEVKE